MNELKVFVSSPGDVAEERFIVKTVLERVARRYAGRVAVTPCFWEHLAMTADTHYQGQIPQPSAFDVVILLLWSRIGSALPPDMRRADGSAWQSGTEYEFEDALAEFHRRGLPRLLVYRKTAAVQVTLGGDDRELMELSKQKRAVEDFVVRHFQSADGTAKAALNLFEDSGEIEDLLQDQLRGVFEEILSGHLGRERFLTPVVEWDVAGEGSPFRGLQRFDYKHRLLYFGRTRAVHEALALLREKAVAGCPFLLVFGKSGVGKSSFARAGMLPVLVEPGVIAGVDAWRIASFEPSDSTGDLVDGFAASLMMPEALPGLREVISEPELAKLLHTSPEACVALLRRELMNEGGGAEKECRLAVLIDPLEEIFTRVGGSPGDRDSLLRAISALCHSGLAWTVATMRSDFYERCTEHAVLMELQGGSGHYHLAPPTLAEIGQMIRLPAQLAGLTFENDSQRGSLDELLLEAASADPAALPLLEFTLDEIFQKSQAANSGVLTFRAYAELGEIQGAVGTRAEETFSAVERELGAAAAATAFNETFGVLVGIKSGVGARAVRLYSRLEELVRGRERDVFVRAFVEARLFLTDKDDEHHPVVTLAHEAILRHWPRLAEWIESNADFLRARDRISVAAERWAAEGRDAAYQLQEGKPLAEAVDVLKNHAAQITPLETEYIKTSARHVEQAHRRAHRRMQVYVSVLSVLLLLALGFAARSVIKANEAARKTAEAELHLGNKEMERLRAAQNLRIAMEAKSHAVRRTQESERLAQFLFTDLGRRLQPTDPQNRQLIERIAHETLEHYRRIKSDDIPTEILTDHFLNLTKVAQGLSAMGRYDEAIEIAQNNEQLLGIVPDGRVAMQCEILDLLGKAHNQLGHYTQAVEYFTKLQTAAPDEKTKRSADRRLGEIYRHLGRYHESEKLLAGAGVEAQSALGELYRNVGRLPESEKLLLGTWHYAQDNLRAAEKGRQSFAGRDGDSADKEKLLQLDRDRAVADEKLAKAADDLSQASSDLGVLRYDQARENHADATAPQVKEAEQLIRFALDHCIATRGHEHPFSAVEQYKLARVLLLNGGLDEAGKLLGESERTIALMLGTENQRMAKCLEALADFHAAQYEMDQALAAMEKVLVIRRKLFEPPHPDLWKTLDQKAAILKAVGRAAEAKDIAAQADAMKRQHQILETKRAAR